MPRKGISVAYNLSILQLLHPENIWPREAEEGCGGSGGWPTPDYQQDKEEGALRR